MKFSRKMIGIIILTMLWLAGSLTVGRCAEITPQWKAEDKRLATPVTLTASSIYLGELLEQIAKQAGVSVSADNHDASSGTLITVHWTQVPLADALNSLWSLLSYQNVEWTWERSDTKEGEAYRLLRPEAAREFGSMLRTMVLKEYEEQMTLMASAATMSDKERKRLAKAHPEQEVILLDTDYILHVRLFYAALPEATRRDAFTNPDGVKVPPERTDQRHPKIGRLSEGTKRGHSRRVEQVARRSAFALRLQLVSQRRQRTISLCVDKPVARGGEIQRRFLAPP